MKPARFSYETPRTFDEALTSLAARRDGAKIIAGVDAAGQAAIGASVDERQFAFALRVNGRDVCVTAELRKLLCDMLRARGFGAHRHARGLRAGRARRLRSTRRRPSRAYLPIYGVQMQWHSTIQAFARGGALTDLQQALHEEHGLQCGFCTPGIVVTMKAWLKDNPDPSNADIRGALSDNLCGCTGHHNIVLAIGKAARRRKAGRA
jgi:carbon-monoxide dehydrogenase small subunit